MRSRRAIRAAVLLPAVATIAIAGFARAQSSAAPSVPILALDWSAPPECPDAAHVKARVEQLVGHTHGDKTLTAEGRMTASNARYRVELRIGAGAPSRRTMTGSDCARLAEAAALIFALDIDPDALARATTAQVEPEKAPAPGPRRPDGDGGDASDTLRERAPEKPDALVDPRRDRHAGPRHHGEGPGEPVEIGVAARLLFDQGSLPQATLGLGAAVEIARGAFFFDLGPSIYQRQFVGGPRSGSGGAYVELMTLNARGCTRHAAAPFQVRACLGGELGREGTRGVGIADPTASSALWGALSIGLEARAWERSRLSPSFGVGVGHPLVAPDVVIHGFGTLFEPPILFVRAHLGLEVRLF